MVRWLLASSPLFVLLFTLLKLKWKAKDAGATALIVALLIGGIAFGGQIPLLAIACAKGMSLTLFVVLIIWTSVSCIRWSAKPFRARHIQMDDYTFQ